LTQDVQLPLYQSDPNLREPQSLRTAIQNFVAHYHSERNHQGLANRLISPEPDHEVQRRQRLGGMLNYYYRAAA
jgi:putative transposase